MARVTGPSRDELDRRGDEFAARVSRAIRATLHTVALETRTVDDLTRIQVVWRNTVEHTLMPRLRVSWNVAVQGVRTQLEKINANATEPLVAAVFEIPKVSNPLAESFLAEAQNRLTAIGDVVWYTARGEMLTGLELGEGVAELRERVVASAKVSQKRAEVIARTEVNSAMNNGAYQQMKSLDVATIKEWIATNDSRTRESHAEVDGEEIAGDAKFMVGGFPMEHPHDLNAPPSETINCRCTLAWEFADDDDDYEDDLVAGAAFHLPGQHNQKTHGHHEGSGVPRGAKRLTAMKDAYAEGYTVDSSLESGASRAEMDILTLSDGTKVVRKVLKKDETRREYLAGRVFDALKDDESRGVTTAQVGDDTILTTYVPGQTGGARLESIVENVNGYKAMDAATKKEHIRQAKLPGAKEMAMLDVLIENHDRHSLNWILPDDGSTLEPIDQGAARFEPSYMWNMQGGRDESIPSSPVGDYWFGVGEFDSGIINEIKPRYTHADVARYRANIAELSAEFQSAEEKQWLDFINRRLDQVEARIGS
jgi:SPP1 gp7 family putative phage head morphogenesis protein